MDDLLLRVLYLFAGTRVRGERASGFQILDDGAEVDRFGIKRFVFGDLCPIQNLEAVTFEHFFAAPALERDYLATHSFLAGAIKITQICTHQRTRRRNFPRLRQQIDMKMRYAPRLGGNFTPAIHQDPANETTRALVVTEVAGQRAEEQPDVLIKLVELILQ